uniref:39S ribosomal protein L44, mitochondrial-like n=1 Tax=Styela clava TaxID=7725 RepID=UPI00193AD217|nr:39S ribosomal protein L44, mitochondrial-like [Styela clava]
MSVMLQQLRIWSQPSLMCKRLQKCRLPCTFNIQMHSGQALKEKAKSVIVGNKHLQQAPELKYTPPIWKHQWLLLLKRKAEIEGPEEPRRRSDQLNWNYSAELHAFVHRLGIHVHAEALKAALTEPMPVDLENEGGVSNEAGNNVEMANTGEVFTRNFITLFVKYAFPELGKDCANSIVSYLMSETLLSYLAKNLGFGDLIQSQFFPLTTTSLTRAVFAVNTAILQNPDGKIAAARFLYDFVIINLNNKDIVHDIWKPQDPMKHLKLELKIRGLPPPEVRLTKKAGITSVLPVVFVGLFCEQNLLAESGGETVIKAESDAAKLALKTIYDVHFNRCLPKKDLFLDPFFLDKINSLNLN